MNRIKKKEKNSQCERSSGDVHRRCVNICTYAGQVDMHYKIYYKTIIYYYIQNYYILLYTELLYTEN